MLARDIYLIFRFRSNALPPSTRTMLLLFVAAPLSGFCFTVTSPSPIQESRSFMLFLRGLERDRGRRCRK